MKINFKKLITREDWETALSQIIDQARTALAEKDNQKFSEAVDLLNSFIEASPPEKSWSSELDDHARDALEQLLLDISVATNEVIAAHTEELRRIAKAVQATAASNEETAAGIRQEKLTQALVSAMNAAKAAKDLQAAVADNASDATLFDAAQDLLDSISKFRNVLAQSDSGG